MSDDITAATKTLFDAALATPDALGMAWEKATPHAREEFVKANRAEVLRSLADAAHREEHPGFDPALMRQSLTRR